MSPKSAPPELKTFQFPGAQKPGVDAAGPEGTAAPGAAAAAGNVTATQGDASELGGEGEEGTCEKGVVG